MKEKKESIIQGLAGLIVFIIGIVLCIKNYVQKGNAAYSISMFVALAGAVILIAGMFHFGNVFCVLAALLLGGTWGGLAGAVGMTISDLTTSYVTSAPKTFLLKLCIGLIVGFVAHRLFHISKDHPAKYVTIATIVSSICGMAFNVVADPIVGYFYKTYLLGVQQDLAKALAKVGAVTTSVNAVIAVVVATALYLALRPVMKKSDMLRQL